MRKEIINLLHELEILRDAADYRSRLLIENGREIPEEHRAKAEGYASAYFYCIMRFREVTGIYEGDSDE